MPDHATHRTMHPDPGPRQARPRAWLRLALRLPIVLYHLHLGWLLGHRILLLTHRGRKTGQARQTVLEVVRFDPITHESIVAAAWGERADWYQNLRASPALEVRTGRACFAPIQRHLTADEVYAELLDYERRHPWVFKRIAAWLGYPLDGPEDARRALAVAVRMVGLRP